MPEIRLQREDELKEGEDTAVRYLAMFATMYNGTRQPCAIKKLILFLNANCN